MQFDSYTQKELKSGFELLWEKNLNVYIAWLSYIHLYE